MDNKYLFTETGTEVLPETVPQTEEPEVPVLLPAPAVPSSEPPRRKERLRTAVHILFGRIFPSVLLVTAVTVYAVLSATLLAGTELSVLRLLNTMLGEFTGGADSVRFTEIPAELPIMEENTLRLPPDTASEPSALPDLPESELPDSAETADNPFLRMDMSSSAPDALALINETPYEPDLHALVTAGRTIPPYSELTARYGADAPVVLILHTHATEAYADSAGDDFRSTDSSENVTAVGSLIADRLAESGIGVIHCTELFDSPDFSMAYYNAALAIRTYIEEYPSISYILDIHRDSILSGETYVRPVTETDGEDTAQIMFVVGTDHGGSGHTGWQDNLALASRLQQSLNEKYPSLMRDINLRSASFNEQYTSGSLLVEIGSCASSLEEVKRAAERFADALTAEILG